MSCVKCGKQANSYRCESCEKEGKKWFDAVAQINHDECQEKLRVANQMILSMFNQACAEWAPYPRPPLTERKVRYDHMCLSSYETAQDYLIEWGLIKPEECSRP